MCSGIALAWSELPLSVIEGHGLTERTHERGGEKEVRFLWQARPSLLPVWLDGRIKVAAWGTRDRRSPLPQGGWTWEATIESGRWSQSRAELVDVPATCVSAGGVWTRVRHGLKGLAVETAAGPVVYLICRPSTRYYRVMTRCEFQPVLIGEVI
jgi:hypothetical protein